MNDNSKKIAVVDLGSNSARLFIFQILNGKPVEIESLRFFCGLGRDLAKTGLLNEDAVVVATDAMMQFAALCNKHNVSERIVVATAALREAKNAQEFLDDIKNRTGLSIRIIDGDEEARLAAIGVLAQIPHLNGVVADYGGGSLELAHIQAGRILSKMSLRLGAHYLKAAEDMPAYVSDILGGALATNNALVGSRDLCLIGGSWRSIAKAWLLEHGKDDAVETVSFKPEDIIQFCQMIRKTEPSVLVQKYEMEEARAALMYVSSFMLICLVEAIKPDTIIVSTSGIRDGLAYDYILNNNGRS